MKKLSRLLLLETASLFAVIAANGQTKPVVYQNAIHSACVNIVALSGNVNLNCSTLTVEQRKAIVQMRDMLRKMVGNQIDPNIITEMNNKLDELLTKPNQGSITQSNSGGLNILQGTTGSGSSIINSPITVGSFPKKLSGPEMDRMVAYLAQAPTKAKIDIVADQFSGASPFPDNFYDALKNAGWPMVTVGARGTMLFSGPGQKFQGAMVRVRGESLKDGEKINVTSADPLYYIGMTLESLRIPRKLERDMDQPEGVITITFEGGFPN